MFTRKRTVSPKPNQILHNSRLINSGSILLIVLISVALFAPWLTPYSPQTQDPQSARLAPSLAHPLGTDFAGRDIYTRLLYSLRLAYAGGFVAVAITGIVGGIAGLVVGYGGGFTDRVAMRFVDLWLAIPGLLFLFVVVSLLGNGQAQIIIAVGLAGIPAFTRFVRSITLNEKQKIYVTAAQMIGATRTRILSRHIAPNLLISLVTYLAATFSSAILAAGSLSFIGLGSSGSDPSVPELGALLQEGRQMMTHTWWPVLGPILVLWLTALGANLFSDKLVD